MKKSLFSVLLLLLAVMTQAQIQEPVKFKTELKNVSADEVEIVFSATIDNGWHCLLYTSPSPRDPKTARMPSSA